MKASRFNVYLPQTDGSTTIYNLISGKYQIVGNSLANLTQANGRQQIVLPKLLMTKFKEIPSLIKAGILIEDNRDELEEYRTQHLVRKFSDPIFRIVVMPTLKCNLRCNYCYELVRQFGSESMTEELATHLVSFVNRKMEEQDTKSLVFSLFGGEPLVNPKICNLLLEEMYDTCQHKNIPYHFPLTTNGYFISDLRDQPVMQLATSVHITIDGDKPNHDQTRISLSGKPSYNKILEGIQFLMEKGTRTIIRIHFNNLTITGLRNILDDLVKAGVRVDHQAHIYLMNVLEDPNVMFEKSCGPPQTELLSEFWSQIRDFREAISDHALFNCFHWESHFPTQQIELRYLSCNHESNSLFTVNADGSFIKCPRFIGDDQCVVGKLNDDGDVEWTPSHQKTLKTSRFDNEVCCNCEYLPICGGNCVFKPLPKSLDECFQNRIYYQQQVEKYVLYQQNASTPGQAVAIKEASNANIAL